ncbi:MAG: ATP-binding protein, partial [Bacteroidota bacterium]
LDLARQPVDLGALAAAVADRHAPTLAARGVALDVHVPADVIDVQADPTRLDQVLDQLLSNAARFTPEGAVRIDLVAEGGRAQLTVSDTGVGIADDALEDIFEPFVQEDSRINRDYDGSGLGLAIASRLVRQMGGTLTARSVKGEGSALVLSLPRDA